MSAGKRPQWGECRLANPFSFACMVQPCRARDTICLPSSSFFYILAPACRISGKRPRLGVQDAPAAGQMLLPSPPAGKSNENAFLLLHFPNILFIRRMVGIPVRRGKQTNAKLVPESRCGRCKLFCCLHPNETRKKHWHIAGDIVYNEQIALHFLPPVFLRYHAIWRLWAYWGQGVDSWLSRPYTLDGA